ncbi:MAG: S1 RNA-binding domain-containing protein, partial [Planctomycetota bacterium]
MTATPILDTLAREFSARPDHIQSALEMLDAGLCAPFIGRFRRDRVGLLTETAIRRLDRRRKELEDLDRRRATILGMLERDPTTDEATRAMVRACMDRFELEDLFIPHRRPEPEVQLALDRGLGALADRLVASVPPEERAALGMVEVEPEEKEEASDAAPTGDVETKPSAEPVAEPAGEAVAVAVAEVPDPTPDPEPAPHAETSADSSIEDEQEPVHDETPKPPIHAIDVRTAMNVQLARVCREYVNPDRGVHTEAEALSGAVRILSDRLGRNARLRGTIRRLLGKHGVLTVRATVDDGRLGRHRSLLKIRSPLRQLQGHRLLAIRQAQKERLLHTLITLDPDFALPKVRSALGRHTHPAHEELLREIALQALNQRLIPMVEPDVRLELKERADQEALRFLAQHMRQILYAPPFGPYPVGGIDVNAKGDWTIAVIDANGDPIGAEVRIETGGKDADALGIELRAALEPHNLNAVALGHGKGPRAALPRLRAALKAARTAPPPAPAPVPEGAAAETPAPPANLPAPSGPWIEPFVFLVNEAGLSSYASSELARSELADRSIAARMAISLARRLQDPMAEILKVDPRHLGLGSEQGLVSKANARRVFVETIESAAAHVGCDVNRAPQSFLEHVPGLSRATVKALIARRRERPFQSREELRADGLLSEAQWTGAAAFLRVYGSAEPLDATGLHPEQYPLVRRLLDSAGASVEQALGRYGATRGLHRGDFDVDDATWRDLMREISWPGRDPRPRLMIPALLEPDTDPVRLVKDRVVEGVVSNVASFGIFVDVGLPADAMVHISEISDRYVRDAREFLSVGQIVRARILEVGGQRLTLSLKNVPSREREPRPGGRGGERGPRGRGQGGPRREGGAFVRSGEGSDHGPEGSGPHGDQGRGRPGRG